MNEVRLICYAKFTEISTVKFRSIAIGVIYFSFSNRHLTMNVSWLIKVLNLRKNSKLKEKLKSFKSDIGNCLKNVQYYILELINHNFRILSANLCRLVGMMYARHNTTKALQNRIR